MRLHNANPKHRLARSLLRLSFILPPSCRFLFQRFSVYRLTTVERAARRGLQRVKGRRRRGKRGVRRDRRETLPGARRAINNQINEKYFPPHARVLGGGSLRSSALTYNARFVILCA